MQHLYTSKVLKGDQSGRTINFPTVNLYPSVIPQYVKQGIYAAIVKYEGKIYTGALYFGPRLVVQETKTVLEIHMLDFHKEIYGEIIEFQIKDFIRGIKHYASLEEMKKDIEADIKKITTIPLI